MHLAAGAEDGVTHVLDDARQLIGTDMRMGIGQDGRRGTMLTEHVQNLLYRAALLGTGVQLAVAISTCPTLAEAVVALGVHLLRLRDLRQVFLALVNILATLQHNGAKAQLYQPEGSKQSTGTCPHDDDLRTVRHVGIDRRHILVLLGLFVDVGTHLQVDIDGALAGIDAAAQDADSRQRPHVEAILVGQPCLQGLLVGSHLRQHAYLILLCHS